ncbi:hypothetical protein MBLNU459_g6961t3 [Dothideomycetes sp. NU459]
MESRIGQDFVPHLVLSKGRSIVTTSSSAPPSSPPIATPPRNDRDADSRNALLESSPAEQTWTAPTGKRSRRSHSPDLPALPPQLTFETPSSGQSNSVRDVPSTDAATYYTASWGSPYQRSARINAALFSTEAQRNIALETDTQTSSPSQSVIGLDYLIPSRVTVQGRDFSPSFGLDHLIPSRVPVQNHIAEPVSIDRLAVQDQTPQSTSNRPGRLQITRSLTEDWVQQYASGRWRSEKSNWLSDDEESIQGSESGSEDFKTPIPFTWFAGRHRRRNSSDSPVFDRRQDRRVSSRPTSSHKQIFSKGHKSRESNLTLRQEDFWEIARDRNVPSPRNMSLFDSRWATTPEPGVDAQASNSKTIDEQSEHSLEKPLPAIPGKEHTESTTDPKVQALQPSIQAKEAAPIRRPRTKLAWRGKTCWIDLPEYAPESCGGARPLSPSDVKLKLRELEDAGYNTEGFDLGPQQAALVAVAQSRAEHPDPADDTVQRERKDFKISFPDPKAWKTYCDWLVEEKLRALGVSMGDEPAPAPMSRQSSGQFAQPSSFSPNMQAAVPNRSHRSSPSLAHFPSVGNGHRSSPSLAHFPMGGHAHSASIASPLNMPIDSRGHAHRHSMFGMPGTMPFGFPQQQNAHSGLPAFSPGQHINMESLQRGTSPALERLKTDGAPARSPGSSFGGLSPFSRSPQPQEWGQPQPQPQAHLRHQSVYSNFSPQLSAGPNSARPIPSLVEVLEEEEEFPQDYFSGVRPLSQQQQQQQQQQPEIAQPSPRGRGHRHNISEGLERDVHATDYHLERSIEQQIANAEANAKFKEHTNSYEFPSKPQPSAYVPPAKRGAKNSIQIHFDQDDTPEVANAQVAAPKPYGTDNIASAGLASTLQNKLTNKVKGHASKLSVAAPEFKFNPGSAFQPLSSNVQRPSPGHVRNSSSGNLDVKAPVFQPSGFGGFGGSSLPSADFNFSSAHSYSPVPPMQEITPTPEQSSIFGNVSLPDVIMPVRRSKAVAIVPPKASPVKEEPEVEDEHGRIMQSDERQKRARMGKADGDDVPLFAARPTSPMRSSTVITSPVTQTDNQPPPELAEASLRDSPREAEPFSAPPAGMPWEKPTETVSALPSTRGHKKSPSSLSALAKPFDFKAQTASYSFKPSEPNHGMDDALDKKPDFSPARVFSRETRSVHGAPEDLEYVTSPEPHKQPPYPESETDMGPSNVELNFDEINAVMQQLNDSFDDAPFEQAMNVPQPPSPLSSVVHHLPASQMRSDAPSPSPRRVEYLKNTDGHSESPLDDGFAGETFTMPSAPIHRLNRHNSVPLSEWSDDLDANEVDTLHTRSRFFDDRIDSIVGAVLQDQLEPLQKSLHMIHRAVSTIGPPRSRPTTGRTQSAVDSDADDEDELPDGRPYRPLSSGKDRKAEQVKAAVLEAFAMQEANNAPKFTSSSEVHQALMDMNTTIARIASANIDIDDVKAVVDESLYQHSRAMAPAIENVDTHGSAEKHRRELSELNGRLNETLAGALEEANQRRAIEERETDTRRLLRLAEEELTLLRETMNDKDQKIHGLTRERQDLQDRAERAELAYDRAEKQLSDDEAERTAFETTLEEYRLSSAKWRKEVDNAASENEALQATVTELKAQIADGLNIRQNMRGKLDKIHVDMMTAAEQLASEKAFWQSRNEMLLKKHVVMQARLEGEVSVRRSVEEELQALRVQVHEGASTKISLEQALRSNGLHEEAAQTLRADLTAEQTLVTRLERDLHEARESGRAEVQRTQMIMQSSIDAANSQADLVRASLEHELTLARNEIDNVKMIAETARARHEHLLEEEADRRRDALRKVNETSSAAMNDLREKHANEVQYLRQYQERAIDNAQQDKERATEYLTGRFNLASDQILHLQDRVAHLEERLAVAKSAAKAAVSAAQATKSQPSVVNDSATTATSHSEPEKISPQALRESILVLQEQLQEREGRIERLQSELEGVDSTAPQKIKERDTEITWLRELLAVRNEDLNDLIRNLEKPSYDKDAVRDTAIRIRANLQMEQQEKERLINAGSSLTGQAVAGVMNFASPRAVQLAAAFGNWRKGSASTGGNSAPKQNSRLRNSNVNDHNKSPASTSTPSKPGPSASPSLFSGLMTPPASNLRRTPSPGAGPSQLRGATSSTRPAYSDQRPSRGADGEKMGLTSAVVVQGGEEPLTPNFLKRQNYDEDAEIGDVDPRIIGAADDELADSLLPDDSFDEPSPLAEELVGRSLAAELDVAYTA